MPSPSAPSPAPALPPCEVIDRPAYRRPWRTYREKRYENELTVVWNDGGVVKRDAFGDVRHSRTIPLNMEDPHMAEFFAALDGLPREKLGIVLQNLDDGEISL